MPCSPRMTKCKAACLHRAHMRAYQDERIRQEDAAREAANGWETEYREFLEANPLLTFADYLRQTRGWSGQPRDLEPTAASDQEDAA